MKRTIMTMNYGLTRKGVFNKIYDECVDLKLEKENFQITILGKLFYDHIVTNNVLMRCMESFKEYVKDKYTKKHKPFILYSTLRPRKIINNDFSVLETDCGGNYDIKMTVCNLRFNKINFNRRKTYIKNKDGSYMLKDGERV